MEGAEGFTNHALEKEVLKVITILFMSHRIQAKVYRSDTYVSFLNRLRKILPNIC